MKHVIVTLLLFFCPLAVAQQDSAAKPAAPGSGNKEAKIRELIRVTGAANLAMDAMRRQMDSVKKMLPIPPQAQDDFADQFLAAVNLDDFTNLIIPIYDKHFGESDLDGMIAFYNTTIGQKVIKEMPAVAAEAQQAGGTWGREVGAKVGARIAERVKAGAYGPWPPAAGSSSPAERDPGQDGGFKPAKPAPPQN